jgi:hypothetical protein
VSDSDTVIPHIFRPHLRPRLHFGCHRPYRSRAQASSSPSLTPRTLADISDAASTRELRRASCSNSPALKPDSWTIRPSMVSAAIRRIFRPPGIRGSPERDCPGYARRLRQEAADPAVRGQAVNALTQSSGPAFSPPAVRGASAAAEDGANAWHSRDFSRYADLMMSPIRGHIPRLGVQVPPRTLFRILFPNRESTRIWHIGGAAGKRHPLASGSSALDLTCKVRKRRMPGIPCRGSSLSAALVEAPGRRAAKADRR